MDSVYAVGEKPHEHPHHRVKRNEHEAGQQAKLGIAEPQIGNEECGQADNQISINLIKDTKQNQEAKQ